MNGTGWKRTAKRMVVVLGLLVALAALPAVAGHDHRLTIEIDEPFAFDGKLYPAGAISMRTVGDYNPTATLHEVWVGNACLGVFVARHTSRDSDQIKRAALFKRDSAGQLVLAGYRMGNGRTLEQYRFERPAPATVPPLQEQPSVLVAKSADSR